MSRCLRRPSGIECILMVTFFCLRISTTWLHSLMSATVAPGKQPDKMDAAAEPSGLPSRAAQLIAAIAPRSLVLYPHAGQGSLSSVLLEHLAVQRH